MTGKINFQAFTKICLWKHQTTSPIGDSIESKLFDELLLIEIKNYDNKFIRKFYGLLRKIIDREDEHDR